MAIARSSKAPSPWDKAGGGNKHRRITQLRGGSVVGKEKRGLWGHRGRGHPSSRGWGLRGRGFSTVGWFSPSDEKQSGEICAARIKSQPWPGLGEVTNGSHGSAASPRAPQPGPQVAADPSPLSPHQRSGPKSGLSISHPQTSSKGHQCLRVAAVLTAAMRWDGSGHAGLPSGPGGEKGRKIFGAIHWLYTPLTHGCGRDRPLLPHTQRVLHSMSTPLPCNRSPVSPLCSG